MKCIVKVYNNEPINNLASILSFKAQKAVFLYDKNYVDTKVFTGLERTLKSRINKFQMEIQDISYHNIEKIYSVCKLVVHQNPDCFFDITGAGEMCAIAAYLACKKSFTPIFTIDILQKKLVNIYGANYLVNEFLLPKLSFDTLLGASGVSTNGNNHVTPRAEDYKVILKFCNAIFEDVSRWKELCFYMQIAISSHALEYKQSYFQAKRKISSSSAEAELNDTYLLDLGNDIGLIKNLYYDEEKVSFSFKNDTIRKYMTDFGVWLEAYTYIKLKKDKSFDDVRMSVKINWQPYKKDLMEITNEIDVVFFYGIHACFVSCKLSEPSSEALQELSMYSNYFGGQYSRCILVTLAVIKGDKSHILRRAQEMGIDIVDGRDIKSGNLVNKIKEILIQGQ